MSTHIHRATERTDSFVEKLINVKEQILKTSYSPCLTLSDVFGSLIKIVKDTHFPSVSIVTNY